VLYLEKLLYALFRQSNFSHLLGPCGSSMQYRVVSRRVQRKVPSVRTQYCSVSVVCGAVTAVGVTAIANDDRDDACAWYSDVRRKHVAKVTACVMCNVFLTLSISGQEKSKVLQKPV